MAAYGVALITMRLAVVLNGTARAIEPLGAQSIPATHQP
jgi:hypothetical protein